MDGDAESKQTTGVVETRTQEERGSDRVTEGRRRGKRNRDRETETEKPREIKETERQMKTHRKPQRNREKHDKDRHSRETEINHGCVYFKFQVAGKRER